MTVDGVGRTSECSSAQRHLVHALAAVLKAGVITFKHFVPGQQVMTKGHWLCGL